MNYRLTRALPNCKKEKKICGQAVGLSSKAERKCEVLYNL